MNMCMFVCMSVWFLCLYLQHFLFHITISVCMYIYEYMCGCLYVCMDPVCIVAFSLYITLSVCMYV